MPNQRSVCGPGVLGPGPQGRRPELEGVGLLMYFGAVQGETSTMKAESEGGKLTSQVMKHLGEGSTSYQCWRGGQDWESMLLTELGSGTGLGRRRRMVVGKRPWPDERRSELLMLVHCAAREVCP
jgi:hypothetical protein